MSIIEKIKVTEEKADKIKEEASLEVSKMLDEVNLKNKELVKNMYDAAKKSIELEYKNTLSQIEKIKELKLDECQKINDSNRKIAKAHLNETVDFILKKVIDS